MTYFRCEQALTLAILSFICDTYCMLDHSTVGAAAQLTFNGAVSLTLSQYFMTHGLSRASVGTLLGTLPQSVSNRLYDKAKWSAEELALLATHFGIPVDALMPTPDGSGGWVPAPYVPAGTAQIRRDPAPYGTGSVVVAGTGFEPATSGHWLSVLYLLVSLHMLHLLYGLRGFELVRELAPSRALILGGYGQRSHLDEAGTGRVGGCSGTVGAVSASGWPQ